MIAHSDSIAALGDALAKAQAKIKGASKDATNPHYKQEYADLASCWDACRDALTENAIAVIQLPSADENRVTVTTFLVHKSGEYISGSLTMHAQDAKPQSIGSAITYGRRYGLCAAVGIAPKDDDGEAAMGPRDVKPEPQRITQPKALRPVTKDEIPF